MNYTLRYGSPANISYKGWEQSSLPIGNSYMGMSIFGGLDIERLQFNDKTLWTGGPSPSRPDYNGGNVSGSYESLNRMRESLISGCSVDLKPLVNKLVGSQDGYGNYQNFGDIIIELNHGDAKDYERGLQIDNAMAYVRYSRANGDNILREHFASYPSRCIVGKITTSGNRTLNIKMKVTLAQDGAEYNVGDKAICFSGKIADNELLYYGKLAVKTDGEVIYEDKSIAVSGASYVEYYLSTDTDYANIYPSYRGADPQIAVDERIKEILSSNYEELKSNHIEDYKRLFNKMQFNITGGNTTPVEYTDEMLKNYRGKSDRRSDRYLEELLFNYGRYLIIASSRPHSLPANLQGVWNASNTPPWGSDYHLNVNFQMNYWHVYPCGLEECATSMIEYMDSLRIPGRITAREYNNIVSDSSNPNNGWVCHVQNTPFGWTCPGWNFNWGWSPASSSWMLQNVYDYYAYTEDKSALKESIFPMIFENAKFWLQNLVYCKEQDRYVSAPTYSPEHGTVTIGNTYEQELIWQLFQDVLTASEILGEKCQVIDKIREILPMLKPLHIGRWGQIKEWYEEDEWYKSRLFKNLAYKKHGVQRNHRHVSHLLGVFPGSHVNRRTPQLLDAAKVSLLDRGFGGTGWSKAYKINLWARLKDGSNAYKMLKQLITHSIMNNLWDKHPPFQIDGNFGLTNGICEMLCYSNAEYIELLPALPREWQVGSIKGMRAKGGYIVDMEWQGAEVSKLSIHHLTKTKCVVYVNDTTAKFFKSNAIGDFVEVNTVR